MGSSESRSNIDINNNGLKEVLSYRTDGVKCCELDLFIEFLDESCNLPEADDYSFETKP